MPVAVPTNPRLIREITIASSKDEEIDNQFPKATFYSRAAREFNGGTTVTITTLASTVFSVTSLITVSSASIVPGTQLQCLAPGASICA